MPHFLSTFVHNTNRAGVITLCHAMSTEIWYSNVPSIPDFSSSNYHIATLSPIWSISVSTLIEIISKAWPHCMTKTLTEIWPFISKKTAFALFLLHLQNWENYHPFESWIPPGPNPVQKDVIIWVVFPTLVSNWEWWKGVSRQTIGGSATNIFIWGRHLGLTLLYRWRALAVLLLHFPRTDQSTSDLSGLLHTGL